MNDEWWLRAARKVNKMKVDLLIAELSVVGPISSTQPNPSQSEHFGPTNQRNTQPNRTPYNQQQTFGTRKTIVGTLFHRNIMTVSKTQFEAKNILLD